jgi:hypothetical protein
MLPSSDLLLNYDSYRAEHDQFQWDVHILIEGTLNASIQYLNSEARAELREIKEAMEKPLDDEIQEHLVDEHVDVLATNSRQESFLRNMALVALASRLTHALRNMARSAESFSTRKRRYGTKGMSEFSRLWAEYQERFGIDFVANKDRVAFVETIREVRNQIVHDGSEANTFKPLNEIDWNSGETGYLDVWFSETYPEYVWGSGLSAEVRVSEEQLQRAIKASIDLVGWLAADLRKKELASIGKSSTTAWEQ